MRDSGNEGAAQPNVGDRLRQVASDIAGRVRDYQPDLRGSRAAARATDHAGTFLTSASEQQVEWRLEHQGGLPGGQLPEAEQRRLDENSFTTKAGMALLGRGEDRSGIELLDVRGHVDAFVVTSKGDQHGPLIENDGPDSPDARLNARSTAQLILANRQFRTGDHVVLTFPAGQEFLDEVSGILETPVHAPDEGTRLSVRRGELDPPPPRAEGLRSQYTRPADGWHSSRPRDFQQERDDRLFNETYGIG